MWYHGWDQDLIQWRFCNSTMFRRWRIRRMYIQNIFPTLVCYLLTTIGYNASQQKDEKAQVFVAGCRGLILILTLSYGWAAAASSLGEHSFTPWYVPKPFEQIPPYFNCLHNMMSMYIFVSYVFGTLVWGWIKLALSSPCWRDKWMFPEATFATRPRHRVRSGVGAA